MDYETNVQKLYAVLLAAYLFLLNIFVKNQYLLVHLKMS